MKSILYNGPSGCMCRREGGKAKDNGQRQEMKIPSQWTRRSQKSSLEKDEKQQKAFGSFVFVKDIQTNRQNSHRLSILF